ncbi:Protein-L-isoaspartate(D-aspartate) O-methyltransferase domain containing protein [Aphelenchoides fujianensis]|nr:Protein-L-isoaspartate(D-aspartate) O-methyltransferase domain containing protein [Aphelenchoides fujianensis]
MATVFNAKTNEQLIEQLRKTDAFYHGEAVRKVMLGVDRGDFAPTNPYQDAPQGIGHNATISAPHMHAIALQGLLDVIKPDSHVLDVGSGSGYLTVCLANMIGPNGTVVGIDHIDELVQLVDQLAVGGRMLIPVGTDKQEYLSIEKQPDGSITKKTLLHVIYVPLTDEEKQRKGRDPLAK